MDQVQTWFGIPSRQATSRSSFESVRALIVALIAVGAVRETVQETG